MKEEKNISVKYEPRADKSYYKLMYPFGADGPLAAASAHGDFYILKNGKWEEY